jgi:hypothetical protein
MTADPREHLLRVPADGALHRHEAREADRAQSFKRRAEVAHNHDVLPVDTLGELIQFEKTLLGSEYFPIDEFADNHALLRSGRVQTEGVITHRFPLDDIAAAFDRFMSGDSGKVLVQP